MSKKYCQTSQTTTLVTGKSCILRNDFIPIDSSSESASIRIGYSIN